MTAGEDESANEVRQMRRTLGDLVALSTLPAIWTGLDAKGIASSLADVLGRTLALDLVYVRLAGAPPDLEVEVARRKRIGESIDLRDVRKLLDPALRSDAGVVTAIQDPDGGTLYVMVTRFGIGENHGILVSGSHDPGFPRERDRVLLGVGANQAAIVVQRRRAEEQTRTERERLRVTLASIGDAVLTADIQGRVTFLNPVAESLTGWTSEEASGQPIETVFHIVHEGTRAVVENPIAKVLREQRVVGLANHTILIARDGTERPIDDSAAPIRGPADAVVGCVLVFRDMSAKKLAEGELRRAGEQARTILESITDAFFALDRDWRFTYVNRHAEKLLDRSKGDLLEHEIWSLYPGFVQSEFERILRRAATDRIAGTVTAHFSDHARWYELHAYPAPDGISVYFRDVSEQKKGETERAALLAAAQTANRAKDEFMAMLGHELRNPLSPILTAVHLLRARGGAEGERERSVIERQVQHLVRLVDDLLDVSRITRGNIELKRSAIEIAEIVNRAVETASPLIEEKRHQLVIEVPPTGLVVNGDTARLAQVISNLLINAAKYTDPGGRIRLTAVRRDADVVVEVTDNGSGISAELLATVFEMFTQERQGIDRSEGGLGLGLAIVRNIVLLHGGTVTATSPGPGSGSTFTVRIPGDFTAAGVLEASSRPPVSPATTSTPERGRVLVVDDNVDSAEMVAMFLAKAGYRVEIAHDGPGALLKLATFTPDIALLDIGLPGMSGYELVGLMREQLPEARLIAITGYGQEADRAQTRAAGFDAHLVKPVELALLMKTIATTARSTVGSNE